jgi:hypothetical protein
MSYGEKGIQSNAAPLGDDGPNGILKKTGLGNAGCIGKTRRNIGREIGSIMPPENKQFDLPLLPIDRWLAPKELAAHFGLQEASAYLWLADGTVPRRYIRYCGRWRMRIHPAAIPELEKIFEAAHE